MSDFLQEGADPFDLQRFISPQEESFEIALKEILSGRKRTHWMWFVFPQLLGLGSSEISRRFGIGGLGEARAYLAHPVLGERLAIATNAAIRHSSGGATRLFGRPDDLKFHSSMTLFKLASQGRSPYGEAIEKFFVGKLDDLTRELLDSGARNNGN